MRIESHRGINEFEPRPDNLIFIRHEVKPTGGVPEFDVYGRMWSIDFCPKVPKGAIFVKRGERLITLEGDVGLYVPPFSFFEWRLHARCGFTGLIGPEMPPEGFPLEPVGFLWKGWGFPRDRQDVWKILREVEEFIPMGRGENVSPLAARTKKLIDAVSEDVGVGDIARMIGVSRERLARSFKKDFGLSPVEYRNRLRVAQSIPALVRGGSDILGTAFDVGFQDLSRFNKQFKRQRSVPPSRYRK